MKLAESLDLLPPKEGLTLDLPHPASSCSTRLQGLVSVITPAHNASAVIARAIHSVAAQSIFFVRSGSLSIRKPLKRRNVTGYLVVKRWPRCWACGAMHISHRQVDGWNVSESLGTTLEQLQRTGSFKDE